MKKVMYFILLFLVIIGMIGGIGYAFYNKAYVIGIGLIVSIYAMIPGVKDLFKKLSD